MHLEKFAPPTGPAVLERDRLIGKLMAWEDKKLVFIHGPAGQGKTTIAAGYVSGLRSPSVWYTLDANDDDPYLFLENLGQAVQQAYPRQVADLPAVPRNRYDNEDVPAGIVHWAGKVFSGISGGLLIIDDYRSRPEPSPFSRLLDALVAATPPSVRFLIISRSRPALDISRLRAKRMVAELDSNDLRFTDAEVVDLFHAVFGMQISTADAVRVNRITEGWAAGLVLMHEYLASAHLPPAHLGLHGIRGEGYRESVFEYLAQEVFSHLPGNLKDFLCRTSVSEHLPAPLMALLTGLPAGPPRGAGTVSTMVNELQRRNLFVSTVAAEGTVVRYHALFRRFLVKQLMVSTSPAAVRRLHDKAAGYFLRTGDPVRAIELYLESGQFEKALSLIERSGRELITRGRTRTLLRLLDTLPPLLQQHPWPLFFRSIALRFSDPRSALAMHDRAHAAFRSSGDIEGQMLTLCGVIEACFHSGGDFRRMARAAVQAQQLVRTRRRVSREVRARLMLALGIAWFFTGKLNSGINALQEAMGLFHSNGDPFHEVSCAIYLAPCALYQGNFAMAQDTVQRGFEAQQSIPEDRGGESALLLVQAMVLLFSGDAAAAESALDACRRIVQENGLEAIDLLVLAIGGWIKLAQGDLREAEVQLLECLRKGERSGKRFFSNSASHLLSIVFLFQRKLTQAKVMSDRALAAPPSDQSNLFRGIYLIMSGAIHGELGKSARAKRELQEALLLLRKCSAGQQEANAHLMLARLYGRTRNSAARCRHLREGFSLGQELGVTYYATFTREQVRDLAQDAIGQDICVDHCSALLGRLVPTGAQPQVRITCMGGFRVERNGKAILDAQWKSRKAKTLIKLLAAQGGGSLSRDRIIDILWPAAPPERHAALLSSLLHRLRKVLDEPEWNARKDSCVAQEDDQFSLHRERVWTDVAAFLAAMKHAQRMRASAADQGETLQAWERAIGLYGGDLLPADAYDDWTAAVRERLRRLYTDALDAAAEISEAIGEAGRSRVLYERMFSFDPCHEQACQWLMARHASEGQRHKAVRVYERHELAVRRELDIEPDERTRRLYRNIISS